MSSAVIIAGGDFPKKEYPRMILRQADHIVCCDGGALKAFLRNRECIFGDSSRLPDAVVGDMDSMPLGLGREYGGLLVHVAEQESNDLSKAFHYVLERFQDMDSITFLAATGKREDHTVGNLGQLMEFARYLDSGCPGRAGRVGDSESPGVSDDFGSSVRLEMVSDYSTIIPIVDSCELFVGEGRAVSILSPDNSLNIKSEGLVWQTSGVVFDNWWKATLNRASEDLVRLKFSHKSIALIILD